MWCEVDGCIWNDDGYCSRSSYVSIDRNGKCTEYERRPSIDLGLETKKEWQGNG